MRMTLGGRLALALAVTTVVAAFAAATAMADTRQIPAGGTASPQHPPTAPFAGDGIQFPEFAEQESEDSPGAASGPVIDRSHSHHGGFGDFTPPFHVGPPTTLVSGFDGLNFTEQRRANNGNQFSVEPPDQGLCVGNGYVVENVNDVFNVYNAAGVSQLPPNAVGGAVDLNTFFGYPAAINRTTGARGPFVTDPTCIYDAPTGRFFFVVLTLEVFPTSGAFTGRNHLDLAVSNTSNPTGTWTVYRIPVQDDGTEGTPNHHCSPGDGSAAATNPNACIGDYPHIGADANGIYLTTNEYDLFGPNFKAAQIYALSKAQLAAGAPSVAVVGFDTTGTVKATSPVKQTEPGFTVWPAQSPGTASYEKAQGGTEYFLSSNAGEEAAGAAFTGSSKNLIVWGLQHTNTLNSPSPALSLDNTVLNVGQYGVPPRSKQPGSGTLIGAATVPPAPLGACVNDTTLPVAPGLFGCWRLLVNPPEPAHDEVISTFDANDTRMQQVTHSIGLLWGSLDTAVTVGGQNRAGIEWFIVKPFSTPIGILAAVIRQGYVGKAGTDLSYPAIGVTAKGRGVMAMTLSGDTNFPSAAYAPIDVINGVGPVSIAKAGAGVDDGFTSYKALVGNPPRTRWGDYGAAAPDGDSMWIASEYIGQTCTFAQWLLAPLGGCPGPGYPPSPLLRSRDALGNWYTRISRLIP